MNKLSKIFLLIIIILLIALIVMIYSYFKMRTSAKENLQDYLTELGVREILINEHPELQDEDWQSLEQQAQEQAKENL